MCLDAGVTLFDTADVYSAGQSEEELGRALGERRKDVLVATKAFGRMGEGGHDTGLSRRHLVAACEDSLRRLGTDWIDLYQVHSVDALVPIEETLRALDDLVSAGKVRYVGCSNWDGWRLMKALGLSDALGYERFVGQQIQYSLLVRDAEQELLPCGVSEGVGALIWSPLAQGFLSGKFRQDQGGQDTRLGSTGALKAWDTEKSNKVLDVVLELAQARGVSASQGGAELAAAPAWRRHRAGGRAHRRPARRQPRRRPVAPVGRGAGAAGPRQPGRHGLSELPPPPLFAGAQPAAVPALQERTLGWRGERIGIPPRCRFEGALQMTDPDEQPQAPEQVEGLGAETADPDGEDDLPMPIEENDANAQPG